MSKYVITVDRQFGSGGRVIAGRIAELLGIDYYDNELISLAAKKYGINENIMASVDEKPTNSLLYSLAVGSYAAGGFSDISLPLNDKVYQAETNLIEELAEKSSCVIVGRCADFTLRDHPHLLRVFITADKAERLDRIIENHGDLPHEKAAEVMRKTDKKRSNYYNFHTNQDWGDIRNYDLCVNSSKLGEEGTAKFISDFASQYFKNI